MSETLFVFFFVKYDQRTRMYADMSVAKCVFKSFLTFYRVQKRVHNAF